MPIIHKQKQDQFPNGSVTADQDYFLDGKGEITNDSTQAAHWVARKGSPISKADQEKYGIPTASAKTVQPEKVAQTAEEKSKAPKSNKAKKPSENKGAK